MVDKRRNHNNNEGKKEVKLRVAFIWYCTGESKCFSCANI